MTEDATQANGYRFPTRRRFMQASSSLGLATTAGCLDVLGFEEESARVPSLVADRPAAVYHPTHVEEMKMVGTERVGPYAIALAYGFPHRFWTVSVGDRTKVSIDADDSMHLMASVWHDEAGVSLPTATTSITIELDGDIVDERSPWAMLSQRMGFHFGDNVSLPEAATYDVSVTVAPIGTRGTGAFQASFDSHRSASFTMAFEPETVRSLEFTQYPEKAGSQTAVDPMGMRAATTAQLPATEDLPGRAVGQAQSGTGVFVVRLLESPPAGVDADGSYLAVSPRTPYNRYPLARLSLTGTIERDGETVVSDPLRTTIDPELGYHLGWAVSSVSVGDELTITVDTPPLVARHEGYETAFFDMEPVTVTI